jgi:hypothetical protein
VYCGKDEYMKKGANDSQGESVRSRVEWRLMKGLRIPDTVLVRLNRMVTVGNKVVIELVE